MKFEKREYLAPRLKKGRDERDGHAPILKRGRISHRR
jgi:hypothetical protein